MRTVTEGERTIGAVAPADEASCTVAASQRLGRYTLLGELGRGGMGVVHEARDEQVGRIVALKLLHAELGGRHAERLVREARALARLSHPNVVQVYEVGKHEGHCFIAMERVTGQTPRDWQRARGARSASHWAKWLAGRISPVACPVHRRLTRRNRSMILAHGLAALART